MVEKDTPTRVQLKKLRSRTPSRNAQKEQLLILAACRPFSRLNRAAELRDLGVGTKTTSGAAPDNDSEEDITDANDFVDQILEEVQTSDTIQAKISPASLGTLHDSSFDVLVHLGARNLALESDWRRNLLFIPLSGKLAAKVEDVSISMDINVNKNGTPALRKLKVLRLSDINITRATGASFLFNWALRSILNWAVNANKGRIIRLVETDGAVAINEAMKDLGSKLNSLNEFRRR
ncbi:hypothetical protein HPB48_002193 [Haemaphysalis longicornis]|uniref:Uncharacterized protein n=1 Tax=Haemaphysalis longicornis TaxID=44386 RepID=A0A9J6FHC9_HAELO|nr:hypothetical protein HPB48_002193 [Haemaphysalis longicornis]